MQRVVVVAFAEISKDVQLPLPGVAACRKSNAEAELMAGGVGRRHVLVIKYPMREIWD